MKDAFEECELDELQEHDTYVTHKWVFVKKLDQEGKVNRYRARLVARGFDVEVEPEEKYAPTITKSQLRLLLAEAVRKNHQVDIKEAYLYGKLNEQESIYLEVPDGFEPVNRKCNCLRLRRAIYGLPQSGRIWYEHLKTTLIEMEFECMINDEAVFKNGSLTIPVFVDDLLLMGELSEIEAFKARLRQFYEFRDGGEVNYFLGTEYEVVRSEMVYKIGLSNRVKITRLIEKFKQEFAKVSSTPIIYTKPTNPSDPKDDELIEQKKLKSIVGSLEFIVQSTKPECAYGMSIVAAGQNESNWRSMKKALKMLAYLKGAIDEKLWFEVIEEPVVEAFSDGSCTGIFDGGMSRTGFAMYYCGCLVD